jgi:putative hemolysin
LWSTSTARWQGIVTLEDLLEEIVGEIEDEFDLPDESVERVDDDTIRIDGTFPIDDFNEQFGLELAVEDYHTVAGFVFGLLGRAPRRATRSSTTAFGFACSKPRGRGSRSSRCNSSSLRPGPSEDDQHEERAAPRRLTVNTNRS